MEGGSAIGDGVRGEVSRLKNEMGKVWEIKNEKEKRDKHGRWEVGTEICRS